MTYNEIRSRSIWPLALAAAVIVGVLAVAYGPSLSKLTAAWESPEYSHGYLVPFFSCFLLWVRRDLLKPDDLRRSWWGPVLLMISAIMYVGGDVLGYGTITTLSLLPCLAGIVLLVGGWSLLRWSWPAIVFLGFMIPLPMSLESMATYPLRRVGTLLSSYILQTFGLPAVAEGNVILLSDNQIGVAEACSGLRMMMSSAALAFAVAITLVTDRPWWERIVIVLSSVPIALAVNIVRITVTGILHLTAGPKLADLVFHDLAGWLMMPMALGMLWLELTILSHLTIEPPEGPSLAGGLVAK